MASLSHKPPALTPALSQRERVQDSAEDGPKAMRSEPKKASMSRGTGFAGPQAGAPSGGSALHEAEGVVKSVGVL